MKGKFYIKPILLTGGLGEDDNESTIHGGNTGLGGGGLGGGTRSMIEPAASFDQISVESMVSIESVDPAPAVESEVSAPAVIADVGEIGFEAIP